MAFATTRTHGKKARVTKNNVLIAYSTGWSITATLAIADASDQGDDWTEGIPGQSSWSGSMDFHMVLGDTHQKLLVDNIIATTPGTQLTDVEFTVDTWKNHFKGNIYITNFTTAPSIANGVISCSFNFQGDGTLQTEWET